MMLQTVPFPRPTSELVTALRPFLYALSHTLIPSSPSNPRHLVPFVLHTQTNHPPYHVPKTLPYKVKSSLANPLSRGLALNQPSLASPCEPTSVPWSWELARNQP